jgi:hypothetical protein
MKTIRKGARPITVQGREYSWLRGRTVTEIRNLETNKAVHVEHAKLEQIVAITPACDCCGENIYNEPDIETPVVMPKAVRHYIMANAL